MTKGWILVREGPNVKFLASKWHLSVSNYPKFCCSIRVTFSYKALFSPIAMGSNEKGLNSTQKRSKLSISNLEMANENGSKYPKVDAP